MVRGRLDCLQPFGTHLDPRRPQGLLEQGPRVTGAVGRCQAAVDQRFGPVGDDVVTLAGVQHRGREGGRTQERVRLAQSLIGPDPGDLIGGAQQRVLVGDTRHVRRVARATAPLGAEHGQPGLGAHDLQPGGLAGHRAVG